MSVVIERPGGQHRVEWGRLYAGYAEFYKVVQTEEMRERVWKWIADPLHDVKAFIAVADGRPVGLTHYRPFSRPLAASTGCFLDDLFVDPGHRGGRVSEQLIAAVVSEAKIQGLDCGPLDHGGGQLPRPQRLRPVGDADQMDDLRHQGRLAARRY